MWSKHQIYTTSRVTLHVSVWVEILGVGRGSHYEESRSTWACELKSRTAWKWTCSAASRSTWACELKFSFEVLFSLTKSHAPRERVSWNIIHCDAKNIFCGHAPRERVSWNFYILEYEMEAFCHAPRERVSWNHWARHCRWNHGKSRSTWACELKSFVKRFARKARFVTLHVSVWVEIL